MEIDPEEDLRFFGLVSNLECCVKGFLTFGYHICEVLLFIARRIVYLSCHNKLESVLEP